MTSPDPISLDDLLNGCISQDQSAWRRFVDHFAPALNACLRYRFRNLTREEGEDVIQDTFAKLVEPGCRILRMFLDPTLGSEPRRTARLRGYLVRMIENGAYTLLARRSREGVTPHSPDSGGSGEEAQTEGSPETPETIQEALDLLDAARKCLEAMGSPTGQRIVLLTLHGHRQREISGLLGVPMGTIGVTITRFRACVRGRWEGQARVDQSAV